MKGRLEIGNGVVVPQTTVHGNKLQEDEVALRDSSVAAVCNCIYRQATYTDTSTKISSLEVTLFLQSVAVVNRQATFTDTSTRISIMEIALYLQSVTVVD